jgi:hypothetical protein
LNPSGESGSYSFGNCVDHLGLPSLKIADAISNGGSFFESDSDYDHEVFMVGQGEPPVTQTEEEIAATAVLEIARSKELEKQAKKVAGKKHVQPDRDDGLDVSDDDEGVGVTPSRWGDGREASRPRSDAPGRTRAMPMAR